MGVHSFCNFVDSLSRRASAIYQRMCFIGWHISISAVRVRGDKITRIGEGIVSGLFDDAVSFVFSSDSIKDSIY